MSKLEEYNLTINQQKISNPKKPLNYLEFKNLIRKIRKNLITGIFPNIEVGQFKVSLQAGSRKNCFCSRDEEGTLAEYFNFDFSVYDENGKINIYLDDRFKNIPYKEFYFYKDKSNEKLIIERYEVFEILFYIEQMDVCRDSYRNKKYYIRIDNHLKTVEIIESTDLEVGEFTNTYKPNLIEMKREKFVGLYAEDKNKFIVVKREYRYEDKYNYCALYPKEIEDLIRLNDKCKLFEQEVSAEIIRSWIVVNKSSAIIYEENFNTWENEMEGQLFDCSANKAKLDDWISKNKGLPLALYITERGRVEEIYGNKDTFLTRLNTMEQNFIQVLDICNGRKYILQHYNWTPNAKYINKFLGNGKFIVYGDAILMCEENNISVSINSKDIQNLFELKYLDESLKKHLLSQINTDSLNIKGNTEKQKYRRNRREQVIEAAKLLDLADGIFKIYSFNKKLWSGDEPKIDIYEVFCNEPKELIDHWIKRIEKLFRENFRVGDKLLTISSGTDKKDSYDKTKEYDKVYSDFINSNPGFSDGTYADAVSLGMQDAR
ncbi:hypothetical protein JHL18_15940 [Clostridium sp. YIM B02505]|uniref:Uncharacterized protein n=1 Tax=Clostridium yunnanense TaxID=2800325 RepID=A0ABS1ES09_9CLOT|nr:hypothetical protein [Clostridium yunnanense]MBK1812114.1 hypothetical protein [Clostridium yunnanense]